MKTIRGHLFSILAAVCFGLQPLLASFVFDFGVSSKMLALLRVICMVPIFVILLFSKREHFRINRKQLIQIVVLSLSGAVLTTVFLFEAYTCIDTGTATALNFSYPVFVLVFGLMIYHERLNKTTAISMLLCIIGVMLFCNPSGNFTWRGFFLALSSGLTYGVYVLYMEKSSIMESIGFYAYTFWFFFIASIIMIPIVVLSGELDFSISATGWFFVILFAIDGGIMATVFLQIGVREIGSQKASILAALEPVTSMLVGFLFLEEEIKATNIAGVIFVIVSTLVLIWGSNAELKKTSQ